MLKTLLKKQLAEVFRGYFYDAKKNKARSKGATVAFFLLFAFLMIFCVGGMFAGIGFLLCEPLVAAGLAWLYFAIMGLFAVLLGAFGSVFNTYAGLYRAKDNDLLFAMPIPVRSIIVSRLLNVYLLGLLYSAVPILPAFIVYWIVAPFSVWSIVGAVATVFGISCIVLVLSCLLGYLVARVSVKVKNKSFVSVALMLLGIGIYYFFYFKAESLLGELLANAAVYGSAVRTYAPPVYYCGMVGVGDPLAIVLFVVISAVLVALTYAVLSRSFMKIATMTGAVAKNKYTEKVAKTRSPFAAVLAKELGRFTSSPMYMLNSGFGVIFLLAVGVVLLLRAQSLLATLAEMNLGGAVAPCVALAFCFAGTMNMSAAPAVSLEGKSIWIPQSLPIPSRLVLRAKLCVQLLLTCVPLAFASVCAIIVLPFEGVDSLLALLIPFGYALFTALVASVLGVAFANLTWTNELTVIKQGAAVGLTLLTSMLLPILLAVGYYFGAALVGQALYLALALALVLALSAFLWYRLETKWAKRFDTL